MASHSLVSDVDDPRLGGGTGSNACEIDELLVCLGYADGPAMGGVN